MTTLDRFVTAQEPVYDLALAELRQGAKHSHWMWYIFPQIAGLGRSENARRYAIADRDEAEAYLAHDLLGRRLAECTDVMLGWASERSAQIILGPLDSLKFASSMTLFEAAGGGTRYAKALDAFFGGVRDRRTLELLES
jgi:uncharacterized protein (DUF1810 family)